MCLFPFWFVAFVRDGAYLLQFRMQQQRSSSSRCVPPNECRFYCDCCTYTFNTRPVPRTFLTCVLSLTNVPAMCSY